MIVASSQRLNDDQFTSGSLGSLDGRTRFLFMV